MNSKIAIGEAAAAALRGSAPLILNLSGGKDSSAMAIAVSAWLDTIGHPPDKRFAIHADLGLIEWPETRAMVETVAARFASELMIVSRAAGGLIERWEQRFANSLARYEALETYCLVGPFSSAKLRFCTSETKVQPIERRLRQRFPGQTIVSAVGLRRSESRARACTPVEKLQSGRQADIILWHPLVDWSEAEIFAAHRGAGLALHVGYTRWGAERIGCSACILASRQTLEAGIRHPGNRAAIERILALETRSAFSFQPGRWLGDIADAIIPTDRSTRLRAKAKAEERRALEAALPGDLRFTRGWPPRIPSIAEASQIRETRQRILAHHGRQDAYRTAADIRDRFATLHQLVRCAV